MEAFSDYDIIEEIGRGRMGVVFRARHKLAQNEVALKVIHNDLAQGEEARDRFLEEAFVLGTLDHPNILNLREYFEEDNRLVVVHDWLTGRTLARVLSDTRTVDFSEGLRWMVQILQGIAYAHEKGVVHGDLKPSNVFVTDAGEVKIMDFGLSKELDVGAQMTGTMQVAGVPAYLPPETFLIENRVPAGEVGAKGDIFAFGVMAYRILSGQLPFGLNEGMSPIEVFTQLVVRYNAHEPITRLSTLCPALSLEVADVVMRCLFLDPSHRPETVDRLLADLMDVESREGSVPQAPMGEVIPPADQTDFGVTAAPSFETTDFGATAALSLGATDLSVVSESSAPAENEVAGSTEFAVPAPSSVENQAVSPPVEMIAVPLPTESRAVAPVVAPVPFPQPGPSPQAVRPAAVQPAAVQPVASRPVTSRPVTSRPPERTDWISSLKLLLPAAIRRLKVTPQSGLILGAVAVAVTLACLGIYKMWFEATPLEHFTAACEDDDFSDCVELGDIFAKQEGTPLKAAKAYRKACDGGHAKGCYKLGIQYRQGGEGMMKSPADALAFMDKACGGGEMEACVSAGDMYEKGEGLDRANGERAMTRYEQACNIGYANGCFRLGRLFETDSGIKNIDPRRIDALFDKACKADVMKACTRVAQKLMTGKATDPKRAIDLFEKSCAGHDMEGCAELGVMCVEGRGMGKNLKRAATLLEKACDGGYAVGCYHLGVIYEDGTGVSSKDPKRAAALYAQACNGGYMMGCNNLGAMYEEGAGVPIKDPQRALSLYEQACRGNCMSGCDHAGMNYREGIGVKRDRKRAGDFFDKACRGGYEEGCRNQKRLWRRSEEAAPAAAPSSNPLTFEEMRKLLEEEKHPQRKTKPAEKKDGKSSDFIKSNPFG